MMLVEKADHSSLKDEITFNGSFHVMTKWWGIQPVKNCISFFPSGCGINHNFFTRI